MKAQISYSNLMTQIDFLEAEDLTVMEKTKILGKNLSLSTFALRNKAVASHKAITRYVANLECHTFKIKHKRIRFFLSESEVLYAISPQEIKPIINLNSLYRIDADFSQLLQQVKKEVNACLRQVRYATPRSVKASERFAGTFMLAKRLINNKQLKLV